MSEGELSASLLLYKFENALVLHRSGCGQLILCGCWSPDKMEARVVAEVEVHAREELSESLQYLPWLVLPTALRITCGP